MSDTERIAMTNCPIHPSIRRGQIVRWRGAAGSYHVTLVELGRKWARIRFFGPGVLHDDGTRSPREKRVPAAELEVSLW